MRSPVGSGVRASMSKSARRLKRSKGLSPKVTTLEAALRPFAQLDLPSGRDGEDIWIYVGRADELGTPPHLQLEDFRRAVRALG